MKFSDLNIQTYRSAPADLRSKGAELLFRAGYIDRDFNLTEFGKLSTRHLVEKYQENLKPGIYSEFGGLVIVRNFNNESYYLSENGKVDLLYCPSCFFGDTPTDIPVTLQPSVQEIPGKLEKVLTPNCNTIKSLAEFLNISEKKTAKALLYTRESDGKVVFVVIRGDQQLSLSKFESRIGKVRLASAEEILGIGAIPGFASPIGLSKALIVVDQQIEKSPNLVAGANEVGFHLLNTNYGRDYSADILMDLRAASAGNQCPRCGGSLVASDAYSGSDNGYLNLLIGIAEKLRDDRGLTFNTSCAPADIYLMNIPGKELDTLAPLEEIEQALSQAGLRILVDDRNERAGVKFNDADLIGCPIRIVVGERALREGAVELKLRTATDNTLIKIAELVESVQSIAAGGI